MENQINWDDINVLRTLSDGWYTVPADSEYAKEMIRHPWKKDGDTRDLAEKRHQAKQEQEQREDHGKDYYEICDHEYTIKSLGFKICA